MARVARLGVVIDSSGAKRGAQETNTALNSIDQTAKRAVDTLKKAGAALGIAFAVKGLQETVDKYAQLEARLRLVTSGSANLVSVQSQLVKLANDTRQSYGGVVDLYTRLARSSDQLGLSQSDLIGITETVNNAIRLSGTSSASAEAGIMQLGQAFASGVLRGEELNSVMEQTPEVARAIADGLGVPIGKLREMGAAGELTADRVSKALLRQREAVADLADQLPATIGQAVQGLTDQFGRLVNDANSMSGASRVLVGAIDAVTGSMSVLLAGGTAVGAVLGARWLTNAAQQAQDFGQGIVRVRAETVAYAEDAIRTAAAQRAASAQRLQELQAEQAAIRAAAAAERERLATATARVARAVPVESLAPLGGRVAERDNAQVIFALKQQADAQAALTALQTQGITVNAALAAEKQALAAAEVAATTATTANAAATSLSARAAAAASTAYTALGGALGVATLGVGLVAIKVFGDLARNEREAAEEARKFNEEANKLSLEGRIAAIRTELELQERLKTSLPQTADQWRNLTREELQSAIGAKQASEERVAALKKITEAEEELARRRAAAVPSKLSAELEAITAKTEAFRRGGLLAAEAQERANREWVDGTNKARTFAQALDAGDPSAKATYDNALKIVTATAILTRETQAATKAQRDATEVKDALRKMEKDYQAEVVILGIELAERATAAEEARSQALRDGQAALAALLGPSSTRLTTLQAEVQALLLGETAAAAYARQQDLVKGVTERLNEARTLGVLITPQVLGAIVSEVEATQRLERARKALKDGFDVSTLFDIPGNFDSVGEFADGMAAVLASARGIAQAFGESGSFLAQMVGSAAQLGGALSQAQRAGVYRDVNGKEQNVGFRGALSGAAGFGGQVAAISSAFNVAGQAVAIFRQFSDAIDLFGTNAREQARMLAERAAAFNAALEDFAITSRTSLDTALRTNISQANQVAKSAGFTTNFRSASDIDAEAVEFRRLAFLPAMQQVRKELLAAAAQFDELSAKVRENERAIRERNAAEIKQLTEDLNVRRLVAAGLTDAADAERLRLQQLREIKEAEDRFGKDSPYLTALRDVQAAETAAAEATRQRIEDEKAAQQARDRTAFGLDMTQRRQTLNGDSRGAFITGQTIAGNSALAQAQQLVDAGTITAAMFEELKTLLGDEFAQALRDFDEAARQAKQAVIDDLAVRALVAQGRNAEAEQARIEIANRKELEGVTDEALRAEIIRVQVLETLARETAKLAEAERIRAEQNASIDQRMIEAYRVLDPAKAKELEAKQLEVDRAREIAEAADAATAARLRELFAMQDAAKAATALAEAMDAQKRKAEELADFTRSIGSQYLRATGRGFDADVADLNEWRTEQLKNAASVGAGADTIAQINAIFDARYGALIAAQMKADAPAPVTTPASFGGSTAVDSSITLGEDTVAVRSARSITEATALQLVDYAASQTALLRRLVQLAEGGSGPTGNALASPSLDLVDRQLGARANTASLLLAGSVR